MSPSLSHKTFCPVPLQLIAIWLYMLGWKQLFSLPKRSLNACVFDPMACWSKSSSSKTGWGKAADHLGRFPVMTLGASSKMWPPWSCLHCFGSASRAHRANSFVLDKSGAPWPWNLPGPHFSYCNSNTLADWGEVSGISLLSAFPSCPHGQTFELFYYYFF